MFQIINNSLKFNRFMPVQPCILCGAFSPDGVWCKACDVDLPRLGNAHCPVCGLPALHGEICGQCLTHMPSFDATSAAFAYAFPMDKLVQAVKFSGRIALTNQLADALASRITSRPDFIVAMPLHPLRLRERGFNQSHLLAERLSRHFGISSLINICSRTRNTPPQSSLPWQERGKNMRGAFNCSADLTGKHIAIVDDVMTTGTTIEELARTLRQKGAVKVSAWILARTLPH
jgi:ComF family protein